MQQVNGAPKVGAAPRRDPAPSRLAYRYQRLLLTPMFRFFMRAGLPFIAAVGVGALLLGDEDIRDVIGLKITEIRRSIQERPEFMVKLMAIDGASDELGEDIREILPLDFPLSSFDLDLEGLRQSVAALDAVASVEMRVRTGGILQIDIEERVPAVVWRGPQGVEVLDRGGRRVGALVARAERPDLPLLTGEGAEEAVPEALELIDVAAPLANRLRGLVRMGERRWDIVLDRDQRILLPERDPVSALERVIELDREQDLLGRDITAIDMRNDTRPTIRLANRAAAELRRVREEQQGVHP